MKKIDPALEKKHKESCDQMRQLATDMQLQLARLRQVNSKHFSDINKWEKEVLDLVEEYTQPLDVEEDLECEDFDLFVEEVKDKVEEGLKNIREGKSPYSMWNKISVLDGAMIIVFIILSHRLFALIKDGTLELLTNMHAIVVCVFIAGYFIRKLYIKYHREIKEL